MSCAAGVDPGLLLLLEQKMWSRVAGPAACFAIAGLQTKVISNQ